MRKTITIRAADERTATRLRRGAILATFLAFVPGCTAAQLAKDEAAASAGLAKVHAAISSGAALNVVTTAVDAALAADPSSPVLQKASTAIHSSQTPADLQKADQVVQGGILVLGGSVPGVTLGVNSPGTGVSGK